MAVLYIDTWSSECGDCGKGAKYDEKKHDTALGYFSSEILDNPDHPARKGCGAVFTQLSSHYDMPDLLIRIQELRPDLEFIG